MKHTYQNPNIEILSLSEEDVIRTSIAWQNSGVGDGITWDEFGFPTHRNP